MESIFRNSAYNNFQVIGYVLILYVMLIVIRFVWLCLLSQGKYSRRDNRDKVSYLSIVLLSVSGVRGALTLAGAFAVASVIYYYEQRIADLKMNRASQDNNARNRELEIILHRHAVAVQLAYIQQLLMEGKVSREDARRLHAILRRVELILTNRFRMLTMMLASVLNKFMNAFFPERQSSGECLTMEEKIGLRNLTKFCENSPILYRW
jgi:hypothetical protein